MLSVSAREQICVYSRPDGLLFRMQKAAREAPTIVRQIAETSAEYEAALRARNAREAAHIAYTNARTAQGR